MISQDEIPEIEADEWEFATWAYQNIASTYTSTGRLNESLGAAKRALEYSQRIKAWARESTDTYMRIAWTKFLMGDIPYLWELDLRNSLIQLELLTSKSKATYAKLRRELLGIQSVAAVSGYKWVEGDTLFLLGELERLD